MNTVFVNSFYTVHKNCTSGYIPLIKSSMFWKWWILFIFRFVSVSDDHTAVVWSTNCSNPLFVLNGHAGPVVCAMGMTMVQYDAERGYALKEQILLTGSLDKTIRVWSLESGECINILKDHNTYVKVGLTSYQWRDGLVVQDWEWYLQMTHYSLSPHPHLTSATVFLSISFVHYGPFLPILSLFMYSSHPWGHLWPVQMKNQDF